MLNKKEVKHIKAILKSKGICFLSNELLDHVCTDIERKLGNEISYKQVLHSFYDQQYISRLKKTNRKLIFIHLTKFIYMKIAIISLIIAAIIPVKNALFSSNSEDEKKW